MATEVVQPLSATEAAQKLDVTTVTVYRWVKSGRMHATGKMPGLTGAYLFDPAEIDRVAAERAR